MKLHLSMSCVNEPVQRPHKTRKSSNNSFAEKYSNLSKCIDGFGTKDLLYLFRQIAEDSGYKYVIANFKKDMAIMKRVRENYTNREIWLMIDFLYNSNQTYLDKSRLSPNVLVSQWCNTIYADSLNYDSVNGTYAPQQSTKKVSKRKSQLQKREWSKTNKDTSKVGEWD